jgi:hypothetical protein
MTRRLPNIPAPYCQSPGRSPLFDKTFLELGARGAHRHSTPSATCHAAKAARHWLTTVAKCALVRTTSPPDEAGHSGRSAAFFQWRCAGRRARHAAQARWAVAPMVSVQDAMVREASDGHAR